MSVIALPDFKAELNQVGNVDDAELQRTLDAAEAHVAHVCGSLAGDGTTLTVHQSGGHLVLPAVRLTGITAVRDPDGNTVDLLPGSANLLSGIVRVPYRRRGTWAVDVTTSSEIPADLRLAVLIIAKHLWETQRVPGAGRGQDPMPKGFAVPHRAAVLMGPYQLPVIA